MKVNKEESIRWINHAITFYKNLGKTQKELADYLGITDTRISELKSTNTSLKISPTQVKLIMELCGSPRRDPGRFESAELYDDLDKFFESYIPVTINRFYRDVYRSLTNNETVNKILSQCDFEEELKEKKLESINGFVRSKEFTELSNDGDFTKIVRGDLKELTNKYGIKKIEPDNFYILRQLNSLISEITDFKLGSKIIHSLSPVVDTIPLVITGERIAAFMPEHTTHNFPINSSVKDELQQFVHNMSYFNPELAVFDLWRGIRVEVYLSENMNYHILIHMTHEKIEPEDLSFESTTVESFDWCNFDAIVRKEDRIAIIRNVNTLELFNQIEELRKWQGLEQDNLYELKKNIAKAGGYIPGAFVLI